MSLSVRYSAFFFLIILLSANGCSSSKPAGDAASGNPDATADSATSQSNADQVGSVPEDMLADEKGVDAAGTAANPEATTSDPFGDLKEKEKPKAQESTAVNDSETLLEGGSGSSASSSTGGGSGGGSGGGGSSGKTSTYTVQAGDTLMKIAFNLYGDVDRWKDLHEMNQDKLKKSSALRKGMKLKYEAPSEAFQADQLAHSYLIKKGDTLAGIADDVYGKKMKYKKLQSYNKRLIKNPNKIFAGFTIFYDITDKEMAEAEAHRATKGAGGGGAPAPAPSPPSAINPPPPAGKAPNVATSPSATDNSAMPGPQAGPPAPGP